MVHSITAFFFTPSFFAALMLHITFAKLDATSHTGKDRERASAHARKNMDRRGMSSENEPNFPGSSGSKKEKNGRTYRQKPKGWLAQSNKRSAKKDRQTVEEEALPMWKKPLSVKRCTLWVTRSSSAHTIVYLGHVHAQGQWLAKKYRERLLPYAAELGRR